MTVRHLLDACRNGLLSASSGAVTAVSFIGGPVSNTGGTAESWPPSSPAVPGAFLPMKPSPAAFTPSVGKPARPLSSLISRPPSRLRVLPELRLYRLPKRPLHHPPYRLYHLPKHPLLHPLYRLYRLLKHPLHHPLYRLYHLPKHPLLHPLYRLCRLPKRPLLHPLALPPAFLPGLMRLLMPCTVP